MESFLETMIHLSIRPTDDQQNRHPIRQNHNTFCHPLLTLFSLSILASIVIADMVFPLIPSSSSYLTENVRPSDEESAASISDSFITHMSRSQLSNNVGPHLEQTNSRSKEHQHHNTHGGENIYATPSYQEEEEERYYILCKNQF